VELRNALGDKFGVELSPTVTLDYPSIAALAAHIADQLAQAAGVIETDDELQVCCQHDETIPAQLLLPSTEHV
jgi:Phosphopantetheine attachment site